MGRRITTVAGRDFWRLATASAFPGSPCPQSVGARQRCAAKGAESFWNSEPGQSGMPCTRTGEWIAGDASQGKLIDSVQQISRETHPRLTRAMRVDEFLH